MCLIVFGYDTVPGYRLILAGNRDEFYDRPTRPADFWKREPYLLAGKDLAAGGTWLGIDKKGRISFLTNYRDMSMHNHEAKSRGHLVKNYLTNDETPFSYLENLNSPDEYNGFNLFTGDHNSFYHFSNITREINKIEPGIHGISNALLNTPWPKVELAKNSFLKLTENGNLNEDRLFELLSNKKTHPAEKLPDTGLNPELEKAVSAIFIQTDKYGTRSSTVLYIKESGEMRFVERVYKPGSDDVDQENHFEFSINQD